MSDQLAANERRREKRISFVAPVTIYDGADPGASWQAQDMSAAGGGMFVAADKLLPKGNVVEIGFYLPGYEIEIITEAIVAWINDPDQPMYDSRKPKGMGLDFSDLEPEFHKVVLDYVAQRTEMDQELRLLELEAEAPTRIPADAGVEARSDPLAELEADIKDSRPAPTKVLSTFDMPPAPDLPPVPTADDAPTRVVDTSKFRAQSGASDSAVAAALEELGKVAQPESEVPELAAQGTPQTTQGTPQTTPRISGSLELDKDPSLIDDLIADSLAELDDDQPEMATTPFKAVVERPSPARSVESPVQAKPDPAAERLDAGHVLGSYSIVKWLGSGGMGDVYLAEHVQLGRKVAIKRLRNEYAANRRALQRFFDEARAVNKIQHENIVQITDFSSEGEHVYCVMEFLAGMTLAELQTVSGAIPLDKVLRIAVQVCDALDSVHKAGVIHRDLKPQNIMLIDQGGRTDIVKLLDFGVAKLKNPEEGVSRETTGSALLGTPGYMSPEQLLGNPVDHRADIYALGVMMYQMTTGTNPFVADTWGQAVVKHATHVPPRPSELKNAPQRIPQQLELLILRCLEKDPAGRPQSVAEIALALRQLTGLVAAGGDLSAVGAFEPPRKRRFGMVAGVLVGLSAVAAAAVFVAPNFPELASRLPWGKDLLNSPAAPAQPADVAGASRPTSASAVPAAQAPTNAAASSPNVTKAKVVTGLAAQPAGQKPTRTAPSSASRNHRTQTRRASRVPVREAPEPSAARPEPRLARETSPPSLVAQSKSNPPPAPAPEPQPKPKPEAAPPPIKEPVAETAPAAPEPKAAAPAAVDHYKEGKALLKDNKALLAIEEFKKAIAKNPRHAKAYRMMGKAYIVLGQESKAIESFEKFVELAPNHKDSAKLRAIIEQFRNR